MDFYDGWNLEDLSIFSPELVTDVSSPYSGLRATPAFVRPSALSVSGIPTANQFHRRLGELISCSTVCFKSLTDIYLFLARSGEFRLAFTDASPRVTAPTEIFVPMLHFSRGIEVRVSDGRFEEVSFPGNQNAVMVLYYPSAAMNEHFIVITEAL
jgi:hypothetical protein